jgi:hypothetical protein
MRLIRAVTTDLDPRAEIYARAAASHGRATIDGDYKMANAAHDLLTAVYRELREQGQRQLLLPLLTHGDAAVRVWAAAHALEFEPACGQRVLEDIASTDEGIQSFNAEQTLRVWRQGDSQFP